MQVAGITAQFEFAVEDTPAFTGRLCGFAVFSAVYSRSHNNLKGFDRPGRADASLDRLESAEVVRAEARESEGTRAN
jgi:hypothetical protein